jgi:mono/diheme cytochrome c family protein
MTMIKAIFAMVVIVLISAAAFIYSGLYPMGADNQHNKITYWALETMRENSIARSARGIEVPELGDPSLLLTGGADYNDMCSACHLKPGLSENDMTIGLYPSPPNLASMLEEHGHQHDDRLTKEKAAQRNFWIIKHGIKASGMPAWGPTHSDDRIWGMVAFLEKLPELTSSQDQILTARSTETSSGHHWF